jgi:hypothetical protein
MAITSSTTVSQDTHTKRPLWRSFCYYEYMDTKGTPNSTPSTHPSDQSLPKILAILGIIGAYFIPPISLIVCLVARRLEKKSGHSSTLVTISIWISGIMTVLMAIAFFVLLGHV